MYRSNGLLLLHIRDEEHNLTALIHNLILEYQLIGLYSIAPKGENTNNLILIPTE